MDVKNITTKAKALLTKANIPYQTIAMVVILGIAILSTVNLRAKLSTTRAELASTQVLMDVVEAAKLRLDSLVGVHVTSIAQRDAEIAKRDRKIAKDQQAIKALQDSLKIVQEDTSHVTADSSYSYINIRIPAVAELKYRFDSTQVKAIHYNFIERDGLYILNNKQGLVIQDLNLSSLYKDNQIVELKDLNNVYLSKQSILLKEKEAQGVQIEGLNKTVKQQKFQKFLTEGTLIGVVGIVVVKALLK